MQSMIHDGRGNMYRIYLLIKSRSKNYGAVVWSRTNFENSTNPRGTVHGERGAMYRIYRNVSREDSSKPHDTTKTSIDSVSRWVSIVFTVIRR